MAEETPTNPETSPENEPLTLENVTAMLPEIGIDSMDDEEKQYVVDESNRIAEARRANGEPVNARNVLLEILPTLKQDQPEPQPA